jgi:hypothetical protein
MRELNPRSLDVSQVGCRYTNRPWRHREELHLDLQLRTLVSSLLNDDGSYRRKESTPEQERRRACQRHAPKGRGPWTARATPHGWSWRPACVPARHPESHHRESNSTLSRTKRASRPRGPWWQDGPARTRTSISWVQTKRVPIVTTTPCFGWALLESNQRSSACHADVLPLDQAPDAPNALDGNRTRIAGLKAQHPDR